MIKNLNYYLSIYFQNSCSLDRLTPTIKVGSKNLLYMHQEREIISYLI